MRCNYGAGGVVLLGGTTKTTMMNRRIATVSFSTSMQIGRICLRLEIWGVLFCSIFFTQPSKDYKDVVEIVKSDRSYSLVAYQCIIPKCASLNIFI